MIRHAEIERADTAMASLIRGEDIRQATTLMMIPSENYASLAVRTAQQSRFGDKYAEGYPNGRYYQGQEYTDRVELLTKKRAEELFKVPHANVQPYSGSPANFAIYTALLEAGDTMMGLKLADGGHLTHGAEVSASSKYFRAVSYGVGSDCLVDFNDVERKAKEYHPKIIIAGGSAYPRFFDWERFADIADQTGAIFMVDMSHYAGLVAGEVYPSPVPHADVFMTTTHKTLRGTRGALIGITKKGLARDPDMAKKIDRAVFPGIQGGPHIHTIAAIGIALHEASSDRFKPYAQQVVSNAGHLARVLMGEGFDLVTGGTDTHLILADLQRLGMTGNTIAEGLEMAGIVANRNGIPHDAKGSAFYPSGLRLGTPALTSRGMGMCEMTQIGHMISKVAGGLVRSRADLGLSYEDEKKAANRAKIIAATKEVARVERDVLALCDRFPIKEAY